MKKRILLLLVFLLALYIVPSILVPTSDHAAILAEPNMTRDFSTSAYGDESPQSITSFSETLPDNVLFRLDNESYGEYSESFAAVGDWATMGSGSPTISTDGDILNLTGTSTGASVVPISYSDTPSIAAGQYIEFYVKASVSSSVQLRAYSGDGLTGSYTDIFGGTLSTTWIAKKGLLLYSCESVRISITIPTVGSRSIFADYVRIGPADDLGWQHDGSTNASITSADSDDEATTDSDVITLTSDLDGASFVVTFDTTATAASLGTAYYPFLILNCTSVSVGDGWKLEQYDGSAWATLQAAYITSSGIYRYNMASLDTYVQKLRLNLTQTATIKFDFLKAYSIANFTYTGSGVSLDDILYVSASTLYCSGTTFTSIVLDHDPALSVVTAAYKIWNVTTGLGTPQFDHYVSAWIGYSSATQGNITDGTLTDIRIKFTASANIAAITFIDIHDWQLIVTVIILFTVPIDETALNWFIIFLGLFMIPASTLYLVKGGRDNLSMNKFFFFIVAFMLGWGLLLGGIL